MTKSNPKLQLQTLKEVAVCSQYASINARLNSNLWKFKNITFTDIIIPSSGYIRYNEMTYDSEIPKNILFATVFSYGTIEPKYPFMVGTAYIFGVPGCVINNAVITFVFRE